MLMPQRNAADHEKTSVRAEKRCFAPFGGASVHPLRKNRCLPRRRDSNGTHVGIRRDQSWKSTNKDGVVALVTCSRPAKHSRRFTGGLRRVSPVRSSNRKRDPSRYRAQTRVLCVLGLIEDGSAHRSTNMIQSTSRRAIAPRNRPLEVISQKR